MTTARPVRVLFLCTGNSCRSQMAESILRHLAGARFEAHSAGSRPAGFIHPLADTAMQRLNISMEGQTSKSWDELAATELDAVITLCDAAAAQPCPSFAGAPLNAHWSLPDPAQQFGTDEERTAFAVLIAQRLKTKIEALTTLDFTADRAELKKRLDFLGEI